jgi:hypothetical protein
MWTRFGLAVVSLGLLWGAEQIWREYRSAVSTDFERHPELMLSAMGLYILAGAVAGLAARGKVRWDAYRISRAVAVGLLSLLMLAVSFAVFGLGAFTGVGALGKVTEIASQINTGLGMLVGLGVVAGFESDSSASGHSVERSSA